MPNNKIRNFFSATASLIILQGFTCASAFAMAKESWLAYGDLRGHLEPCGCDPATDMGGVKRISAILHRERLHNPDLSIYSLGNTPPARSKDELKIPFLLEAESLLKPDAVLVNKIEILFFSKIANFPAKIPYVLSNLLAKKSDYGSISSRLLTKHAIVFGYTFDESLRSVVKPLNAELIANWHNQIQREDPNHKLSRVLLFSSDNNSHLTQIIDTALFDVIISSNGAPFDDYPGTKEKVDESLLVRFPGRDIHMVPLGGQGILRGGEARFLHAKPLSDLLSQQVITPVLNEAQKLERARNVTWLTREVGGDDHLAELFRRYNDAAKVAFSQNAEQRAKSLLSTPFIGVEACKSCHYESVRIWKDSKHSNAMKTLINRGKDKDGECVQCHVLAATEPGGFVSLELSPQFADVQCEVCHGPRKEHVQNPVNKPRPAVKPLEVCVSCHNAQHSPSFELELYWSRIKHGAGH